MSSKNLSGRLLFTIRVSSAALIAECYVTQPTPMAPTPTHSISATYARRRPHAVAQTVKCTNSTIASKLPPAPAGEKGQRKHEVDRRTKKYGAARRNSSPCCVPLLKTQPNKWKLIVFCSIWCDQVPETHVSPLLCANNDCTGNESSVEKVVGYSYNKLVC